MSLISDIQVYIFVVWLTATVIGQEDTSCSSTEMDIQRR